MIRPVVIELGRVGLLSFRLTANQRDGAVCVTICTIHENGTVTGTNCYTLSREEVGQLHQACGEALADLRAFFRKEGGA